MWDFLSEVLKSGGVVALLQVAQLIAIGYLYKQGQSKDELVQQKDTQLLEMSEKRLQDALESRDDFEELSKNLDRSIDLLIKIIKNDD